MECCAQLLERIGGMDCLGEYSCHGDVWGRTTLVVVPVHRWAHSGALPPRARSSPHPLPSDLSNPAVTVL